MTSCSASKNFVSKLHIYSRLYLYSLQSSFSTEYWFLHSLWIILASKSSSCLSWFSFQYLARNLYSFMLKFKQWSTWYFSRRCIFRRCCSWDLLSELYISILLLSVSYRFFLWYFPLPPCWNITILDNLIYSQQQ